MWNARYADKCKREECSASNCDQQCSVLLSPHMPPIIAKLEGKSMFQSAEGATYTSLGQRPRYIICVMAKG